MEDLTSEKRSRTTTIPELSYKRIKHIQQINNILLRTLQVYASYGGKGDLDCSQHLGEDLQTIIRDEIDVAEAALK